MRVCTHTRLLSTLSLSPYLWIQCGKALFGTVAVPLFFHLSEAAQSSLSVALLCLYSALLSALHMLCGYLHAVLALCSYGKYRLRQGPVSYVFNVKRIFHQISPMYMQIPTSIFWSGNWIIVHNFQISLLAWCAFICLRSSGYSGALQSWLCKVMVKKHHNHLLITIYFSSPLFFGRLIWTPILKMNPGLSMAFPANMRAQKTWSLPVPPKCVPLESRWWRKWR